MNPKILRLTTQTVGSRLSWMASRLALLFLLSLPVSASVVVTKSDSRGVAFRYEPGEPVLDFGFQVSDSGVPGVRQVKVTFPDADNLAGPGEIDLPVKVVRVGIPQTGGAKLSFRTGPVHEYRGIIVPTAVPVGIGNGGREAVSWNSGQNPSDQMQVPVVELRPVQQLRDIRFVEVRIMPAVYRPDTKTLAIHELIEVELTFDSAIRNRESQTQHPKTDPLDPVIGQMLLNGKQALNWKVGHETDRRCFFDRAPYWVKIKVDSTGLYRILGSALEAAGANIATIDPNTLALFSVGEHDPEKPFPDTMCEVPMLVTGDEDGRFDRQDKIIFYGLAARHWTSAGSNFVTNYYTRYNAYWLSWGGRPGKRIMQGFGPDTSETRILRDGLEKVRREQDTDCPARSGLLWIWRTLTKDSYRQETRLDIELQLPNPVVIERISGRLYSESMANCLALYLNHRLLDTFRFDVAGPSEPKDFSVQSGLPANFSSNKLTLVLTGDGAKKVHLDYLEVEYRRRLSLYRGQLHFIVPDTGTFRFEVSDVPARPLIIDVTDRYAPRMNDGFEQTDNKVRFCYRVWRPTEFCIATEDQLLAPASMSLRQPGKIRSGAVQADYWVITPAEYLPAATRLARYRSDNVAGFPGCRTRVAVLEDIYDEYGFGMEEPGAIKWFLADKRPAYGLLCGDATYDYLNNLKRQQNPGVPAYEFGFGLDPSGIQGLLTQAYDAWYADFDGNGSSPDMILGRVTCRTGQELAKFVDKLVAYEKEPAGMWNKRFLLLADDEWQGRGSPDPISFGHIRQAEGISVLPGSLMEPVKVYLTEYPFTGIKSKAQAKLELLRQLVRGCLALVFFGHGDAFDLCHESVFNVSEVDKVENGPRLPFCFFGSCSVGRFEDTRYECIAEELVRRPDGGAIATVAATKATASGVNEVFCRHMFVPLFRDSAPEPVIGTAFYAAWPVNRIYHLFGDPATRIRRPRRSTQNLTVWPDTLQPGIHIRARTIVELPEAVFSWTAFGPRRYRIYRSERGETGYYLPGLELSRGNGQTRTGQLGFTVQFPLGVPLDTVFVGDGFYTPVPKTCRVSVSLGCDSADVSLLADTLAFGTEPVPSTDRTGPKATLFFQDKVLEDNCQVPARFVLEGVVSDSSGVMTCRIPGYEPLFFVNSRENETDLTDVLVFDDSSSTTARFRLAVKLDGPFDTLWVIAADNVLNRSITSMVVKPVLTDQRLVLDSTLVYPNPVRREAYFTFRLNRAASVRVRIFTLQGRMLRDLGDITGVFGYNQVIWDGKDRDGQMLPNGVYLVSLSARTAGPTGADAVSVRERFLVLR